MSIVSKDRNSGRAALDRLGKLVDDVLAETGIDEDELVRELTRSRRSH